MVARLFFILMKNYFLLLTLLCLSLSAPTFGLTKAKNKSPEKGETSQRVAHGVRPAVGYKKRVPDAGDVKIGRGEGQRDRSVCSPCRVNVPVPMSRLEAEKSAGRWYKPQKKCSFFIH